MKVGFGAQSNIAPVIERSYHFGMVCRRQVEEKGPSCCLISLFEEESEIFHRFTEYEGASSSLLSACVEGGISLILEI